MNSQSLPVGPASDRHSRTHARDKRTHSIWKFFARPVRCCHHTYLSLYIFFRSFFSSLIRHDGMRENDTTRFFCRPCSVVCCVFFFFFSRSKRMSRSRASFARFAFSDQQSVRETHTSTTCSDISQRSFFSRSRARALGVFLSSSLAKAHIYRVQSQNCKSIESIYYCAHNTLRDKPINP